MAFKDQVINFILQGKDLFSSVAQKSEKAMLDLAAQSEKLNAQLDDIRKQQEAINTIDDLTAAVGKGERAYVDSTQALQHLQDEQKAAAKYAKQLADEQAAAASKASQLEQDYQKLTTELAQYDAQVLATKDRIAQLSAEQTSGATASEQQAAAIAAAKADLLKLEQAQTDTKTSAQLLSTELEQQRLSLDSISTESDKASRTSAEYAAKVKLARGELSTLGTALNKNQRTLTEQKAVLDKAGISMDDMADASAKLKQQEAAAEVAIKDVNTRLQKHQKLLDESKKGANDFGGSIKSATTSLLAMAGAYVGIDRLWESLKSILETGDRFAAFNAQMTAMMGSIAGGQQATAWIQEFANNTGSKLESVQAAFAKLKAFGIDPMNGSLQSMVDFNAKLGGSQQDLEGIILAVGQAWAKQKLQGEEILQLVERGVPVWQLLEQVTGKNVVELNKLSQAGKLGQETIKALVDEMGNAADGQAALSLDRLSGQLNVISNNWEVFKNKVADAGLYTTAIDFLKQLNAKFDELNANGKLKQLASDISSFFTTILNDGGNSLQKLLDNISAFTKGLSIVGNTIKIFWNGLTAGVSVFAAAVTQQFANIAGSFSTLLAAVGADKLSAKLRETQNVLNALSDAYKQQVIQDGADISAAWDSINANLSEGSKTAHNDAATAAEDSAKRQQAAAADTGKVVDQQIEKVKEYELAMAKAGITTTRALEGQAKTAKDTYDQVKAAMKDGTATINDQQQAYLKWAEAEIKAAAAGKTAIDAAVLQQGASLGLTVQLQDLITKNYGLRAAYYDVGTAVDDTTSKTRTYIRAQTDAATATDKTTGFLHDQGSAFDELGSKTNEGATYVDLYLSAQQALNQQFDFSSTSTADLKTRYDELQQSIMSNLKVGDSWWKALAQASNRAFQHEQAVISQTIAYRKLEQQIQSGTMSIAELDTATMTVDNHFRDLDSQMLDNLRSAIADARSEMLALRDDLKSTVTELQDELDQLNGVQKDQELETLKQRKTELKQQLAEAKAAGDKEAISSAEKALTLAQKIYDTKKQQAKLEQDAAQSTTSTTKKSQSATSDNTTTQQQASSSSPASTTTSSPSESKATLYLMIGDKQQAISTTQSDLGSLMNSINQAKLSSGG